MIIDLNFAKQLTAIYITSDNEIYTWGKGARGRLGTGNEDNTSEPKLVKFQEKLRVISISSNRGTTLAVTKEGDNLVILYLFLASFLSFVYFNYAISSPEHDGSQEHACAGDQYKCAIRSEVEHITNVYLNVI